MRPDQKGSELRHRYSLHTARGEDYSQVAGFEAGADDYITKPVKPKVLTSRLKALLRRRPTAEREVADRMSLGDLIIDPERYHIELASKVLDLPRKEFELLSLLASKPGKVFPRRDYGPDLGNGGYSWWTNDRCAHPETPRKDWRR